MTTTAPPTPGVFGPDLLRGGADPYPLYRRLRRESPLRWIDAAGRGAWIVSRYDDCLSVLRHPDGVRAPVLGDDPALPLDLLPLSDAIDPDLVQRLVEGARVPAPEALGERLAPAVDTLLDRLLASDRGDLVADLAVPLAVAGVGELLGVPEADRPLLQVWLPQLSANANPGPAALDARARFRAAARVLGDYLELHLRELERCAAEPLSLVPDAAVGLVERSAAALRIAYLGYEATVGLLGNGLLALLRYREALETLGGDPALAGDAVRECLRFDPPLQLLARELRAPVRLRDALLDPERPVWLLLGSANRDEAWFDQPHRFDLRRTGTLPLTSGLGGELDPGLRLASGVAEVAFARTARRLGSPGIRLGTPRRRVSLALRRLDRLPVQLR